MDQESYHVWKCEKFIKKHKNFYVNKKTMLNGKTLKKKITIVKKLYFYKYVKNL